MLAFLCRSAVRCLPSFPAENSRSFGKEHKNSRFLRQKIQKFALILFGFTFQNHFRYLLGVFLGFKVLLLLRSAYFGLQKFFCCLPEAISGFKSGFTPCLACFQPSKVLSRLAWRVFSLQKFFHALLGVFLAFKSSFVAPLGVFWASKVLLRPIRGVFGLQKCFVARQSLAYRLFVCSQCSHFCRFAAKSTKIRVYSVRVAAQCAAYRVFVCSHRSHFCRFAAKSTKTRGHLGKVFSFKSGFNSIQTKIIINSGGFNG